MPLVVVMGVLFVSYKTHGTALKCIAAADEYSELKQTANSDEDPDVGHLLELFGYFLLVLFGLLAKLIRFLTATNEEHLTDVMIFFPIEELAICGCGVLSCFLLARSGLDFNPLDEAQAAGHTILMLYENMAKTVLVKIAAIAYDKCGTKFTESCRQKIRGMPAKFLLFMFFFSHVALDAVQQLITMNTGPMTKRLVQDYKKMNAESNLYLPDSREWAPTELQNLGLVRCAARLESIYYTSCVLPIARRIIRWKEAVSCEIVASEGDGGCPVQVNKRNEHADDKSKLKLPCCQNKNADTPECLKSVYKYRGTHSESALSQRFTYLCHIVEEQLNKFGEEEDRTISGGYWSDKAAENLQSRLPPLPKKHKASAMQDEYLTTARVWYLICLVLVWSGMSWLLVSIVSIVKSGNGGIMASHFSCSTRYSIRGGKSKYIALAGAWFFGNLDLVFDCYAKRSRLTPDAFGNWL